MEADQEIPETGGRVAAVSEAAVRPSFPVGQVQSSVSSYVDDTNMDISNVINIFHWKKLSENRI